MASAKPRDYSTIWLAAIADAWAPPVADAITKHLHVKATAAMVIAGAVILWHLAKPYVDAWLPKPRAPEVDTDAVAAAVVTKLTATPAPLLPPTPENLR